METYDRQEGLKTNAGKDEIIRLATEAQARLLTEQALEGAEISKPSAFYNGLNLPSNVNEFSNIVTERSPEVPKDQECMGYVVSATSYLAKLHDLAESHKKAA